MAWLLPTRTSPAASSGSPHRGLSVGRPDDPRGSSGLSPSPRSDTLRPVPWARGLAARACVSSTGNGPGGRRGPGDAARRNLSGPGIPPTVPALPQPPPHNPTPAGLAPPTPSRGAASPRAGRQGPLPPVPAPGDRGQSSPSPLQGHGGGASRARGPERTPGPRWDPPPRRPEGVRRRRPGPEGLTLSPPLPLTSPASAEAGPGAGDGREEARGCARPGQLHLAAVAGTTERRRGRGRTWLPVLVRSRQPSPRAAGRRPPGPRAPRAAHRCGARTHHPRRRGPWTPASWRRAGGCERAGPGSPRSRAAGQRARRGWVPLQPSAWKKRAGPARGGRGGGRGMALATGGGHLPSL